MFRAIAAAFLATLCACSFEPDFAECAVRCGDKGCPSGLSCGEDGFCHGDSLTDHCGDTAIDAAATDGGGEPDAMADAGKGPDGGLIDAAPMYDGGPAMAAGDLVITEIMYDPSTNPDQDGEWFEIHNPRAVPFQLQGLIIQDDGVENASVSQSLEIQPGEYLVLGFNGNTDDNGGVTLDYEYGVGFVLANGVDEIELRMGGVVIDRVQYNAGPAWPDDVEGESFGLAPAILAGPNPHLSNDVGSNWCAGTTPYGDGDLGSPGSANPACVAAFQLPRPIWQAALYGLR